MILSNTDLDIDSFISDVNRSFQDLYPNYKLCSVFKYSTERNLSDYYSFYVENKGNSTQLFRYIISTKIIIPEKNEAYKIYKKRIINFIFDKYTGFLYLPLQNHKNRIKSKRDDIFYKRKTKIHKLNKNL